MSKRVIAMVGAGVTALGMISIVPATAAPSSSEGKKPYVVLMTDAPALGYKGGIPGLAPTKPAKGEKIDARSSRVQAYVGHLKRAQRDVLKKARVSSTLRNQTAVAANGFAVNLTASEAARVRLVKGVAAVEPDELRQKQTDVSPTFLGLTQQGGAWSRGLTGKGVVVGVIDTGIWPEHPSFADPGGLPKPKGATAQVPCEFGDTAHNPLDKPFTCQNKLIGARDMRITYKEQVGPEVYNSARDYDGHGTHTASTAAGNRDVQASIFGINRGKVSGIAYQAGVIAYSALGDLGGYGSDLGAAIDQAVADGVDVINYSIGSASPRLGLDGLAFLWAQDAGVSVATSNGNAGPNPSTTGSPAFLPWLTAVGASTTPRTFNATLTLGDGQTFKGASITEAVGSKPIVDATDRGNPLCLTTTPFSPALNGEIVLCERGSNARVDKSKAVKDGGGSGMVLMNNNDQQALVTDSHWLPSVHVSNSDGLKVRAYIHSGVESTTPTASITQGMKERAQGSVMADFSSRGPVGAPGVADVIRPDVTAPGVNILAGNTPTPGSGRPGQLFQSISGTSMSSPHVAGLFALLKQAHPRWSPAVAKSALMTTARQNVKKEDGVTPADAFDMGAGHVNPGKPMQRNSMFDPGLAYDVSTADYAAFACGNIPVQVFSPATCTALATQGHSTEAAQLNLPSIGVSSVPGVKVVKRTVTNVSGRPLTVRAQMNNPDGYRIVVSPSRMTIPRGQSATFTMSIRNLGAPVGVWRQGALKWVGAGYSVRSPIAVKGSAIGVAPEVSVSGTSGTASVPVTFGYTGPYSVTAHGLAPDRRVAGSVAQDPDATFDPSDVGNGATKHTVDLSDIKLWRLTLGDSDLSRPGAGVDVDVYVYGPNGQMVASSGASGTDESVELRDPAPGTYTVYVHGWGVGSAPVDYSLHTWAVPNATGGTLAVKSAPTEAKVGTSGTVTYTWSGAQAGSTELGVLSHKDGNGELALTVVSVKN